MANLDWSQCPAVESIPGKVSGAWVFKDTRMPVSTVFENLEAEPPLTKLWSGSMCRGNRLLPCWSSRPVVLTRRIRPFLQTDRCPLMRILFDHGTPAPLIPFLTGHSVTKAKDAGWDRLVNGELLKAAEQAGFEVLITTDKNMVTQQNLKGRAIAIVVLGNSQWRIV